MDLLGFVERIKTCYCEGTAKKFIYIVSVFLVVVFISFLIIIKLIWWGLWP